MFPVFDINSRSELSADCSHYSDFCFFESFFYIFSCPRFWPKQLFFVITDHHKKKISRKLSSKSYLRNNVYIAKKSDVMSSLFRNNVSCSGLFYIVYAEV